MHFVDDPKFKDMPHLFLQRDGGYFEWLLPNGLPSEADPQKRVVLTDEVLGRPGRGKSGRAGISGRHWSNNGEGHCHRNNQDHDRS